MQGDDGFTRCMQEVSFCTASKERVALIHVCAFCGDNVEDELFLVISTCLTDLAPKRSTDFDLPTVLRCSYLLRAHKQEDHRSPVCSPSFEQE